MPKAPTAAKPKFSTHFQFLKRRIDDLERQASAHSQTTDPSITTAIMSEGQVTLRTRKFIRNPLLGRKQMVVCVQPPTERHQHRLPPMATPPMHRPVIR